MVSIATTTSSYGGGDYTWLKSARGTEHPQSGTLDVSAFTITDGYIPSGTPLKASGGLLVPADTTSSSATLAGFLLHDVAEDGSNDLTCAYITDATIDASEVPGTHDLTDGRYLCDQQDDSIGAS